jgi:hypothetical protein
MPENYPEESTGRTINNSLKLFKILAGNYITFRGQQGASGHAASDLYRIQPSYLVFFYVLQIMVVVLGPLTSSHFSLDTNMKGSRIVIP